MGKYVGVSSSCLDCGMPLQVISTFSNASCCTPVFAPRDLIFANSCSHPDVVFPRRFTSRCTIRRRTSPGCLSRNFLSMVLTVTRRHAMTSVHPVRVISAIASGLWSENSATNWPSSSSKHCASRFKRHAWEAAVLAVAPLRLSSEATVNENTENDWITAQSGNSALIVSTCNFTMTARRHYTRSFSWFKEKNALSIGP